METANHVGNMFGDKLYQVRARQALPILVRQAMAKQPISYSDLAEEMGMPNPRNLNYVLYSVGETLLELSKQWNEEIPLINYLVINKNTLMPGDGIGYFMNNPAEFKKLQLFQQRTKINVQLQMIYAYKKWNEILQILGLPPALKQVPSLFVQPSPGSKR